MGTRFQYQIEFLPKDKIWKEVPIPPGFVIGSKTINGACLKVDSV